MISLENVTYTYPYQEKCAVKDINLEVKAGEIVVCTGLSGCGKTTLMRLINGLCPHYFKGNLQGSVKICGEDTIDKTINYISQLTGSLFQDPEQQFFALNVDDELAFALECKGESPETIEKEITKAAIEFKIDNVLNSSVTSLSEGQKQKVGLAGIILQKVKVIVLDEPTANLDVESTKELADKLFSLKKQGYAIFIVDHRLYWTKDIADRYIVMSEGQIIKEGSFEILKDDEFRKKYGLRNIYEEDIRDNLEDSSKINDICLNIENMSFNYKDRPKIFDNVSFSIPYGITAILGHNGAGKTTLARLITGLNKISEGSILLNNNKVDKKILQSNASLVLQNADFQLYMGSCFEEVYTCIDIEYKNIAKNEKKKQAEEVLEKFGLTHLKDRHPQSLSGGEKQRLVIACAVSKNPNVIILDEPTSGLDGKNMQNIADILKSMAEEGTAVIVITHDLELINKICRYALRLPVKNITKKAV